MNKREILAIDAAKLYYLEGWSQARIAKAFGISRPTVSKLLSLSRTEGFARIEIKDPRKMGKALSRELELRYGLKEAMVVWENGGNVLESVCKTAAEVLSELVEDGDSIGITGGRTIGSVGKNLAILDRVGVKVIQLKGGISLSNSGKVIGRQSIFTELHLTRKRLYFLYRRCLECAGETSRFGRAFHFVDLRTGCKRRHWCVHGRRSSKGVESI